MANTVTSLHPLTEREIGAWHDLTQRALDPNRFYGPDSVCRPSAICVTECGCSFTNVAESRSLSSDRLPRTTGFRA